MPVPICSNVKGVACVVDMAGLSYWSGVVLSMTVLYEALSGNVKYVPLTDVPRRFTVTAL